MQTRVQDRIVFGAIVAALALVVGTLAVALTQSPARPTLTAASAAVVPQPAEVAATEATPSIPAAPMGFDLAVAPAAPSVSWVGSAAAITPADLVDSEIALAPEGWSLPPAQTPAADDIAVTAVPETNAPAAPEQAAQDDADQAGTVEIEHHLAEIPDPPQVGGSGTERSFEVTRPDTPSDPWAAVRRCESHNNYAINTGNGFYGAYQFTISTWNWVAEIIGRSDLIGVRPDLAAPADQDRMAEALAFEVPGGGLSHWPVCGRLYG